MAKQEVYEQGGATAYPEPMTSTLQNVQEKMNGILSLRTAENNHGIITADTLLSRHQDTSATTHLFPPLSYPNRQQPDKANKEDAAD